MDKSENEEKEEREERARALRARIGDLRRGVRDTSGPPSPREFADEAARNTADRTKDNDSEAAPESDEEDPSG